VASDQPRDKSEWKGENDRISVGLPTRPFLYSIDQVAMLLCVSEKYVTHEYGHWTGRSIGIPSSDRIEFRNIAPEGASPEWRCSERELIRFLRHKGYKYYERGFVH
jgi:hypothetical protein